MALFAGLVEREIIFQDARAAELNPKRSNLLTTDLH